MVPLQSIGQTRFMASQHWKAAAGAQEVTRIRHAVADYTARQGVPSDMVNHGPLAVSEVVSNCVVHAFPAEADGGTIPIMATVNGDEITVRVDDDGIGFAPRLDSP